jgi:recombination protein RecT
MEIKKKTVDVVDDRIKELQNTGEIDLPEDYSVGNALKSAWLKLQETQDKNKNPVLESCSKTSIQNALFDTVVQGFNPSKDQVYYIAYGKTLVAMASYFGNMTLAKRADPAIEDIWATTIYADDEVEVEIKRSRKYVKGHKTKWNNKNDDKVAGVYATVSYTKSSGKPDKQVIMTLSECKEAWSQGVPYKENNDRDVHNRFTSEMAKKTAINRICKPIIKSSSDNYLFRKSLARSNDIMAEEKSNKEIEENANTVIIDVYNPDKKEEQVDKPMDEPKKTDNPEAEKTSAGLEDEIDAEFDDREELF